MLRVFICPACGETRMVSKFRKADCCLCGKAMKELPVSYGQWVNLDQEARQKQVADYQKTQNQKEDAEKGNRR